MSKRKPRKRKKRVSPLRPCVEGQSKGQGGTGLSPLGSDLQKTNDGSKNLGRPRKELPYATYHEMLEAGEYGLQRSNSRFPRDVNIFIGLCKDKAPSHLKEFRQLAELLVLADRADIISVLRSELYKLTGDQEHRRTFTDEFGASLSSDTCSSATFIDGTNIDTSSRAIYRDSTVLPNPDDNLDHHDVDDDRPTDGSYYTISIWHTCPDCGLRIGTGHVNLPVCPGQPGRTCGHHIGCQSHHNISDDPFMGLYSAAAWRKPVPGQMTEHMLRRKSITSDITAASDTEEHLVGEAAHERN